MKQLCAVLVFLFLPSGLFSEGLEPMEYVDLGRYIGKWYEVALIPNKFQKKCIEGAVATYSLSPSGKIEVLNQCRTNGGKSKAKGVAWVVDKKSQAKLKVSFVPLASIFHWFAGDYWILYVDDNYEVAIVGEPSFRYLWFLSRSPHMDDQVYNQLIKIAENKGYTTSNIKRVRE